MLANQYDCALEKGTSQLPAVQQQLPFQELLFRRHGSGATATAL
jgi:hypothetical protein